MHLWELDSNGNTIHNIFDHDIPYYVKDPNNESDVKDMYGTPVIKKFTSSKTALKQLKQSGTKLYESDLSEEIKFLHSHYQDKDITIEYDKYKTAIIDIEIQGENEFPDPEFAKYPINLISIDDYRNDKVTTFGLHPYTGTQTNFTYYHCKSEEDLLGMFIAFMRKEKFAIVSGWYSAQFDWPYIINRCKNLDIDYKKLSPINRVNLSKNKMGDWKPEITGMYILDGMDLYKKFSYQNQSSYTLNFIGMIEVDEGKLDYEGQINDLYKRDWNLYVEYNVQDCLLCRKIELKRKFIDLAINLGIQTRIPLDKVYSTIAVVEGYIIRYLHRYNMVMSDREIEEDGEEDETIEGGYVMTIPGFYKNLLSIDATSEYPTLIRMINISPETKTWNPENPKDYIKAHTPGLYYKKEQGIIPKIVTDIFNERKQFKKLAEEAYDRGDMELFNYYDSQQLIRKILINSIYGAMASKYFHYFDLDNAAEITLGGRTAIQYIANCINTYFSKDFIKTAHKYYPNHKLEIGSVPDVIVYVCDTDSNYISFDKLYQHTNEGEDFLTWALKFEKTIFANFLEKCMDIYASKHNTENLLNFKREKVILKMYVQAKKKYITYIIADEKKIYTEPKTKVTGVEINKSDLCAYSRKHIKKFAELMFEGDTPNKQKMLDYARKCYKEFKLQPIESISTPKGIGNYNKYEVPLSENMTFITKTPMANKASLIYNYVIKNKNLPYMTVANGTKIKYIYIKDNNPYKTPVIAYIGNYPKEFKELFKVDYDTQFEKQFLNIAQRMFDVLGFDLITMKDSKLKKLIEEG